MLKEQDLEYQDAVKDCMSDNLYLTEDNFEKGSSKSKNKVPKNIPSNDYENIEDYFPFPSKRQGQPEILAFLKKNLLDPKIKYILVEAGTGIGKSGLALAAAGASKSAYVATVNKFLQNQYLRDFSHLMTDLKGRANYVCNCYTNNLDPTIAAPGHYNCANSPCRASKKTRDICSRDRACEYHRQLDKASEAQITCFNFAAALAFLNYLKRYFRERNLLICDECHNIPDWITNFVSVEISLKTLKELGLQQKIPDYTDIDEYGMFIVSVQAQVNSYLETEGVVLDAKIVTRLETFKKNLDLFDEITNNKANMENFVFEKVYEDEETISKIIFQPVVISHLVQKYLFKYSKKVVLFSATILDFDTYTQIMGIDPEYTAIIRLPSTFPVENRPIYTHMNVGFINKNNLQLVLPSMVDVIKSIIDFYPDYKGIIHGVTYQICNYINQFLDTDRLMYPKKSEEQKDFYDRHIASDKPTILLSPSMMEGVDLKDDASRFQIIVKTPYAYLGNPVLRARMEIYPNYYNMLTALSLTQAYGRSIRSEIDFCFTFVLDKCFLTFVNKNGDILQSCFIKAVQS